MRVLVVYRANQVEVVVVSSLRGTVGVCHFGKASQIIVGVGGRIAASGPVASYVSLPVVGETLVGDYWRGEVSVVVVDLRYPSEPVVEEVGVVCLLVFYAETVY